MRDDLKGILAAGFSKEAGSVLWISRMPCGQLPRQLFKAPFYQDFARYIDRSMNNEQLSHPLFQFCLVFSLPVWNNETSLNNNDDTNNDARITSKNKTIIRREVRQSEHRHSRQESRQLDNVIDSRFGRGTRLRAPGCVHAEVHASLHNSWLHAYADDLMARAVVEQGKW